MDTTSALEISSKAAGKRVGVDHLPEIRSFFPGLEQVLYFNTASHAAGSTVVHDAYKQSVDAWFNCRLRWEDSEQAASVARSLFARFINATPDAVALVPYVSTAAGVVASQLPPGCAGENILVPAYEFASNYYPWLLLQQRGYEVRRVPAEEGAVSPEAFSEFADNGTRLIAVSAVQAATGYKIDLAALSKVAARSGAWLFADGAQAVGAVDVDVVRDGIDFLAVPSHKYLLGTRGMGYLYVRPTLLPTIRPILAGWHAAKEPLESFFGPDMALSETASKLDTSLAWFPVLAEPHALGILDRFGLPYILQRNRCLTRYLYEQLEARGLLAYSFPEAARSPIVTLQLPDAVECMARLEAARAVVGLRSGRIRLSVHFYNTESEIDRLCELFNNHLQEKSR
jgi:cysteine desulfurase/selenocysteine lyase